MLRTPPHCRLWTWSNFVRAHFLFLLEMVVQFGLGCAKKSRKIIACTYSAHLWQHQEEKFPFYGIMCYKYLFIFLRNLMCLQESTLLEKWDLANFWESFFTKRCLHFLNWHKTLSFWNPIWNILKEKFTSQKENFENFPLTKM